MSPMTILIFVIIPKLILAGNILFFMPFIPKSGRITWMPIAEELAARNHNVTLYVVCHEPHCAD